MQFYQRPVAWFVLSIGILALTLWPSGGLVLSHPSVVLCLGVIGLGLCIEARQQLMRKKAQPTPVTRPR